MSMVKSFLFLKIFKWQEYILKNIYLYLRLVLQVSYLRPEGRVGKM